MEVKHQKLYGNVSMYKPCSLWFSKSTTYQFSEEAFQLVAKLLHKHTFGKFININAAI